MTSDARNHLRTALSALSIVGTLGTWGQTALDGTLVNLLHAVHGADDYILPGSTATLRNSFTGIYWPVDYLLQVLVIFFWEAVDGSHPATSAIGIYFLGQLFPILVAFYMISLRAAGGQGSGATSLIRPTLWLLSFQMCALGCAGSVWALSHIAASSPATSTASSLEALQSASMVPAQLILLILPALLLGYVLPFLMALLSPTIVINDFQ